MSMSRDLRTAIHEVGVALRRPEDFTTRWRDRRLAPGPRPIVFPVLIASAVLGIAAYGLVMRLHEGWGGMLGGMLKAPVAAGLAWTIALPALYILNSALGSRLDASTTLLAALTTVSFGSLALLASIPITFHGVVLGLAAELFPPSDSLAWYQVGHPMVWMPLALIGAFLGALCICLPSFYFYTQLSGLDASFRLVTAQALRAQATKSVLLLGVLPFYAAWLLGTVVGVFDAPGTALFAGMCLPFAVGLLGIRAVYRGFCDLAEHLPITHKRRGNFLRRLVLCWGGVYTVVAPVALYRLGEALSARL